MEIPFVLPGGGCFLFRRAIDLSKRCSDGRRGCAVDTKHRYKARLRIGIRQDQFIDSQTKSGFSRARSILETPYSRCDSRSLFVLFECCQYGKEKGKGMHKETGRSPGCWRSRTICPTLLGGQ